MTYPSPFDVWLEQAGVKVLFMVCVSTALMLGRAVFMLSLTKKNFDERYGVGRWEVEFP